MQGASVHSTQPFAATIKKSKATPGKTLVVKNGFFYKSQIDKFKDGEEVMLLVTNRRPKRTEQQNAYYWGAYLPLIADKTGESDLDRLHELFKGKFLTQGIVDVLGNKVRLKKSTTELSVSEFCQYIMNIETETGVQAPPTENYSLVALKEGIKSV